MICLSIFQIINIYTNNKSYNSIVTKNIAKCNVDNPYIIKKENNNDIIGSIKITGTNIDTVLVQGTDNDYYLENNYKKEKDYNGSIYLDYRNTLSDRKLLIYGHNSKTLKTALFHDLEKYLNKDFYVKNKIINLSINNIESAWKIFSIMIIKENDNRHMKVAFNDEEWIEHLSWMKKETIYNTNVDVSLNDRIITLQTCYYEPINSYLVISAKKI